MTLVLVSVSVSVSASVVNVVLVVVAAGNCGALTTLEAGRRTQISL